MYSSAAANKQTLYSKALQCAAYLNTEINKSKNIQIYSEDEQVFIEGGKTCCTITAMGKEHAPDGTIYNIEGVLQKNKDSLELQMGYEVKGTSGAVRHSFGPYDDFKSVKRIATKFFIADE